VFDDLLGSTPMTLATCGVSGKPHPAPVYFTHQEKPTPQLCFFSEEKSQHAYNLVENPAAAAAIYSECYDWKDIRGLQMRGQARRPKMGDASRSNQEWELL
jgi:uncharacterized protein YhbP (UPF0306 family)